MPETYRYLTEGGEEGVLESGSGVIEPHGPLAPST